MNCKYHKNIQSEYICSVCHSPICEDCMSVVDGKRVCKKCIEKKLWGKKNTSSGSSNFWSLVFALMPGCGQMYMGLMDRGLQLLTAFMGIFVLGVLTEGILIALSAIIWFYSFFDSLNIRRQILMGESVADEPVYPLNMKAINPKNIGYGLVVIGGLTILRRINSLVINLANDIFNINIPTYWIDAIYRNIVPTGLLILGILLIRKAKNIESPSKETIDEDKAFK